MTLSVGEEELRGLTARALIWESLWDSVDLYASVVKICSETFTTETWRNTEPSQRKSN